MRIRKNAKAASICFSSSHASPPEPLQAHVCQLNQSPWDAISFSQSSPQLEGDDSFTENASLPDSIGAVESVASLMDGELKLVNDGDNGNRDNTNRNGYPKNEGFLVCNKTDGKGWHCRKEAKEGHYLCEHHFNQLKSYSTNSHHHIKKSENVTAAAGANVNGVRRGGRARKKGSGSSSNPYEMYYYSGFGPSWGKKRGNREGEMKIGVAKTVEIPSQEVTPSSSSQIDNEEFVDYIDDDDEEDEENGRKRMRKPVKARSLKSLM